MARRRRRAPRLSRPAVRLVLLAVAAALGLLAADRSGLLGRSEGDLSRYQDKTFQVERVVDGDTIVLATPDGSSSTTTVRLRGADTPETVRPRHEVEYFGPEASQFTRQLAEGQQVRLKLWEKETRDQYHRLLAYVYLPDGRMLNRALIEEGYGYADPRYDHPLRRDFQQAMEEARRQGRGLWREARPGDYPDRFRQELTRHQPVPAPNP